MKLARSLALGGLLALISSMPAKAQDTATAGGWVDWGSGVVGQALDAMAYQFRQAWTIAWRAIGDTEAEIASEKAKFVDRLKSDLASFSKDVSRTGYDVSQIGISPGIIPKITMTLEVREPPNESEETELRTEFQNSEKLGTIERTILLGLLDLDETAAGMTIEGHKFSEVQIEVVAIFPEVTLYFDREESSGDIPAAPKSENGASKVLSN